MRVNEGTISNPAMYSPLDIPMTKEQHNWADVSYVNGLQPSKRFPPPTPPRL
jgi:hypothetical protein